MSVSRLAAILAVVLSASPTWALRKGYGYPPVHRARRTAPAITYDPIHPSSLQDFEVRTGGNHNPTGDYVMQGLTGTMDLVTKEYGLRDSESFYWGPDGNPLANLTAYADGKAVRVISLERFDNVLQTAECGAGSVKLTFTKEVQFDAVQASWRWVNNEEDNYIVLVTESAQCNVADGDATIRQPWHITHAVFDDNANTVTLSAEPKTWGQAFSNWRLKINSQGLLPPQQQKLLKRTLAQRKTIKASPQIGLAHDFSNIAVLALVATADETHSSNIDGLSSSSSASVSAHMTCTNCSTHGSLDFDIDITPSIFKSPHLKGYISVTADNVGAVVQVQTSVSGSATLYKGSLDLFDVDLPYGGINIKGVCELTPNLKFTLDGNIGKITDKLTVLTGLTIDIPKNASYYMDVHDHKKNNHTSWKPIVKSLPVEADDAVSISASLLGSLKLDFHGTVLGAATAEIGLLLAAPNITLSATSTDQNCTNGLALEADMGMSFDAYESASMDLVGTISATQTIWDTKVELYSTCVTKFEDFPLPTMTAVLTTTTMGPPYPMGNSTGVYGTRGTGLTAGPIATGSVMR